MQPDGAPTLDYLHMLETVAKDFEAAEAQWRNHGALKLEAKNRDKAKAVRWALAQLKQRSAAA